MPGAKLAQNSLPKPNCIYNRPIKIQRHSFIPCKTLINPSRILTTNFSLSSPNFSKTRFLANFCKMEEANRKISLKDAILEGKDAILEGKDAILEGKDAILEGKDAILEAKDAILDVVGCGEGSSEFVVKAEDLEVDNTEYSSSFGDTFSGSDEGLEMKSCDLEVESSLCMENGDQSAFGEPVRFFKKKKVTTQWRKFISPLMWRCQWLELRMKELQSQVLRYDKEQVTYTHEKQLQLKMIDLDDSVSRSVPLMCKSHRKPAMKRRKRKRIEDSINILSYLSNHNIFSCYEKKRGDTDGHSVDDDFSDQANDITRGSDDHLWALDFRDGDRSREHVLLNIESLQSRVLKLKVHLNQIISTNVRDVGLVCSFVGDQPVSSTQSPSCSLGNAGHQTPVGIPNASPRHASDYEMDDIVLPGSSVSSFGDAPDLDIIETTIGFLSGADCSLDPNQLEELCKDNADDVLINNPSADEELQNYEVSHVRERLLREIPTLKEPNSDDESTAPRQLISYTGKKRGRKPKRRRRGGFVAGWKSERLQKKRKFSD